MGVFQKLFGKTDKKPIDYKETMTHIMGNELDLEPWFMDLTFSIVEKEEQDRSHEEMMALINSWGEEGKLSRELEDEDMLKEVYLSHKEWVKEKAQFHYDVRQGPRDRESMDVFINNLGEPFISIMDIDMKHTYFALWGEMANVFSQVG